MKSTSIALAIGLLFVLVISFAMSNFPPISPSAQLALEPQTQQQLATGTLQTALMADSAANRDSISLRNPCQWWCNANEYDSYILRYSAYFGVPDPMLIKAQVALESAFELNATRANFVCGGTDDGLMQLNPGCNKVNASLIFSPIYNLYWGIQYWSDDFYYMHAKWGNSCALRFVLMGTLELYNEGARAIGNSCGTFPLGTNYISLVMRYYQPFTANAGYVPLI